MSRRALVLGGVLLAAGCAPPAFGAGTVVGIADSGSTTSVVSADLTGRALTARGLTVTRTTYPSAAAADAALRAGTLDAYVTDSATLLERVYGKRKERGDSAMRAALAAEATARAATVLGYTAADDAPAVACTRRAVKAYGITGLLRLPRAAGSLTYGATPSHMVRADGYLILRATFRRVIVQTGSGRFGLVNRRLAQCVFSSAAEPRAARLGLVTLRDTTRRLAGTPRRGVTVVSAAYLAGAPPEFRQTVDGVGLLVSTPALTAMRGRVELNGTSPAIVAEDFLRANKVIP